jgi:hypothetical protein
VDANEEEPQRAMKLSAGELLYQIAVLDAKTGHYRFDEEAMEYLEKYLDVFLVYMSGPLPVSMNMKRVSRRGYPLGVASHAFSTTMPSSAGRVGRYAIIW